MITAAIYETATGRIVGRIVGHPEQINVQCPAGHDFYLNCPPAATHIIEQQPVTQDPETPAGCIVEQRGGRPCIVLPR